MVKNNNNWEEKACKLMELHKKRKEKIKDYDLRSFGLDPSERLQLQKWKDLNFNLEERINDLHVKHGFDPIF